MNPVQPLKDYQVLITRGKGQADGLKESIEKKWRNAASCAIA
ncbi:hypothetical protein RCO48_26240 [Peribacillus frigoritolerans]|nr:hypothetical protein [Peribacillus frigoritolerans]